MKTFIWFPLESNPARTTPSDVRRRVAGEPLFYSRVAIGSTADRPTIRGREPSPAVIGLSILAAGAIGVADAAGHPPP
jgi:hypothetical protein